MNTLGTIIGYGLYYLLLRKIEVFKLDNTRSNIFIKYSAFLNIILFFLLNFLIGKPYRNFIWEAVASYLPT